MSPLEALLLTRDPQAVRTVAFTLDALDVDLQACSSVEESLPIINRHRFDTVLVDCDDAAHAPQILQAIRASKVNRNSIVLALLSDQTTVQQAYQIGANFALDKPVSAEQLTRSMRAAQGLIMLDRRGHRRNLHGASGAILVDTAIELPVTVTSISESGVSIECARQLDEGGAAKLRILLPGSKKPLELKGEIIWTTIEGRAGIRFQILPLETKHELETWIEKRALPSDAVFINAMATVTP